jgi:hypothetical protein
MFIADDLKTVTPGAIESAIAIAMGELLGGTVTCRVDRIDFAPDGAGYGVNFDIQLARPFTLEGESAGDPA